MEIKKNGVLFRVAYGNRQCDRRPEHVGLWTFAARFLWMLSVYWPVVGVLTLITLYTALVGSIVLGCAVFLVLVIPGFLFCRKPMLFRQEYGTFDFCPYEKWPTILGRRVYPFWVLVILASATYPERAKSLMTGLLSILTDWTIFSKGFWITEVSVLLLFGLFALVRCSDEIGMIRNAKTFLLARKQKYCPTVKVVE